MKTILLTVVADRDVDFYLNTADIIVKSGHKVEFVSFYQPGQNKIVARGYRCHDVFSRMPHKTHTPKEFQELAQQFKINEPMAHLLHEKLTFSIDSESQLCSTFSNYLLACDNLLSEILKNESPENIFIIQELAGFLGPLGLFYSALNKKINHYFTEPSFFKGHIHFLKNSLNLSIPRGTSSNETKLKVDQYIQNSLLSKTVVAASKDKHHYKDMGVTKLVNSMNARNLFLKLAYKYIYNKKFIFNHISNHVFRYVVMLKNRTENSKFYKKISDLPNDKALFYFPFHVQLDFSLTIRSPQWLDQLSIIEKTLELLPDQSVLIAKEHPASIGCLDQDRLKKVLNNKNFYLMHPQINSHDLIDRSTAIITINSKVGAEARSKGLPVLTFGKAFYTETEFTYKFSDWVALKMQLSEWQKARFKHSSEEQKLWFGFLSNTWDASQPIELYDNQPNNIAAFSKAILSLN